MTSKRDLDGVIERYHAALDDFMKGNPEPLKALYSRTDDVTLGNPFGPFASGWSQVDATMTRAATNYREGEARGFESVAKCVTPDLAYTVETELYESKVGGRDDVTPFAARCTTVFRPEDGEWKIVHRHADPITTPQAAESVLR